MKEWNKVLKVVTVTMKISCDVDRFGNYFRNTYIIRKLILYFRNCGPISIYTYS